ncbi:DUF11 domain-containing protein [Leucobacter sp. CSA2]|uniref:DUF11 domain-containing protein n=1 Tax=Leucobacter edaphi TaxID=2796472 RepID=A0A934QEZ7_9MICO|nr:isopeptide-forming domain-containing fimbrial protein [Leucobacter edaphi]MBK0422202.1 DUF11 domain-containing protein [Leucobacter edaphi]
MNFAVRKSSLRGKPRPDASTKRRGGISLTMAALMVLGLVVAPTAAATAAPGDLASGVVVVDSNKNNAIDSGATGSNDTPLAGVKVTLRGTNPDHPGWTVTTDAQGHWSFPANVDHSASPGPFKVTLDAAGVNGNAYLTPTTPSPGVNDFTRVSGQPQRAVADVPANANDLKLNALVYPTWSTNVIALADPAGYDGKAIYTGTAPFDGNDTEPGFDRGEGNNRVRTSDVINYNWSVTANAEQDTKSNFTSWFEQTITLGPGAIATFGQIPTSCDAATSTITALPSGTVLKPRVDPPAGTTSVVLKCNLGLMGSDVGQKTLDSQVFVSGSSQNGATFTTSVRTYGATPEGVTTARPDGPHQFGPFEITAAPRYDLEKQRPWVWQLGEKTVNGQKKFGWEVVYSVQISTDRKTGVEAFKQPVTFEDSFWATSNDGKATLQPGFEWEMVSCEPDVGNTSVGPGGTTVYGKIGGPDTSGKGKSDASNSVVDSGSCAFQRTGDPKTGKYLITLSGIDTSGASFPTKSKEGTQLPANKFYVGAYAIKIFVPFEAVDAMDGIPGNATGTAKIGNRVGDFDPNGISGASNYGSGFEPGYCQPGPGSDQNTKCAKVPNGSQSNNVAALTDLTISPGSWGKVLSNPRGTYWFRNAPLPESANTLGDGSGQVQPGQTFASSIATKAQLDMKNFESCDVFDNSMMKLDLLKNIPGDNDNPNYPIWNSSYSAVSQVAPGQSEVDRSKMEAFQSNFTTKYAHVDLTGDSANTGTFDDPHNRWKGDWTKQRAAASGTGIACGNPNVTWYDSPDQVPGGIDAVNAVWLKAKPGYVQPASSQLIWVLGLQQRDTFFGGPNDGKQIPELTIAANFANVQSDSFGKWVPENGFIPGAGNTSGQNWADRKPSNMGDRWSLVRAQMAITKHTINGKVDGVDATGASNVGVTGSAKAGTPVIWQIDPTLTATNPSPAPVPNVVVTDTLPKGVEYDAIATAAIAGNLAPGTATTNADGTTTLTWNLGTRTPNEPVGPFKVVTRIDPLLPNNTSLVNKTEIRADGVSYNKSSHFDDHTVVVTQPGSLQLKKSVDAPLDVQDKNQVYTLQVRNFAETLRVQAPTIIDVMPYNGDATNDALVNRNPASKYSGTSKLSGAPQAFLFDGATPAEGTFYYTTIDPAKVPQDLNKDTDPSIWSTTFTTDATAWKFVAKNPLERTAAGATSGLQIKFTMNQDQNAAGDLYVNRFTAFSDTFKDNGTYQMLTSNQVMVRVLGYSIGDLIWFDANNDGKFTPGVDTMAPEGVKVEVYDNATGKIVKGGNVTTNKDGRWVVNDLPEGSYYAVIPASELAPGGPLAGYVAQTVGYQADPNNNVNEAGDHNGAAQSDGSIKTGALTLKALVNGDKINGQAPLNDNTGNMPVTPGTTDDFTNFTLDMALKAPPGYKFTKTADPVSGTAVQAGSTITYTVTGENTGKTPLDVVINDDLTKVLEFATLTDGPTATIDGAAANPAAELSGTALSWKGALKPGQKVTVVYTVTVNTGHEGETVNNHASSTATPPYDPPITPPDVVTEHPIPGYDFTKTADPQSGTAVQPGDTITYTLTGTNTGATVLDPVNITDDLSKVLNHADLVGQPTISVTGGLVVPVPDPALNGTTLNWTGKLDPKQTVTISYTVKVKSDAWGVLLENHASSDATPPLLPPITPPDVTTEHPTPKYEFAKTADPATGTAVQPGDTITYTLTGTNSGKTDLDPVVIHDDLSKVLDNATITTAPAATINGAPATDPIQSGTSLDWNGALKPGETVTITYTVTLNDDAWGVLLENHASSSATPPTGPPITPPDVKTEHPTPKYEFTKTSDPKSGTAVQPNDTITYTLTGKNSGKTVLDPVNITDDLSKVLNNAAIQGDPTVAIVNAADGSPAAATPLPVNLNGTDLSWSGTLEPGQNVVITYTVKLNEDAWGVLLNNHASSTATPPTGPPITPPEVTTEHPTPKYEFAKTSDPKSGTAVNPGQTITYTLTGTNSGKTDLDPVVINDDLSKVLNNAELTTAPEATIAGESNVPAPEVNGTDVRWTGSLKPGQEVKITYTVTLNKDATGVIVNNHASSTATPPTGPPITPPEVETWHPTPGYTFTKNANPVTGSAVQAGDLITYTLTGVNSGQTVLDPVTVSDDMSGVLEFATMEQAPTAKIISETGVTPATAPDVNGTNLSWNGSLQKGERVEITYTVQVKAGFEGKTLHNRAKSEATPPELPPITPPEVVTEHPIPGFTVTKSSDPKSGSTVKPGSTVTYTVTGSNTGATVLDPVNLTDDLSKVLNHAKMSDAASAVIVGEDGGHTKATAPKLSGTTLTWDGKLAIGERVELSYTVRINDDATGVKIRNVVTGTATPPGLPPIAPPPAETTHQTASGLEVTGGESLWGVAGIGALLLAAGGVLMIRRRKQQRA